MGVHERKYTTDRLFNFRPLLFSSICLALGVAFAYLHIFKDVSAWWSLCLLPFAAASFCFCDNAKRLRLTLVAVVWLIACFACGFAAFKNKILDFSATRQYAQSAEVVGQVKDKTCTEYMLILTLDGVRIDGEEQNGRLKAYFSTEYVDAVSLADVVRMRGFVQTDVTYFDKYGFRANDVSDNVRFSLSKIESFEIVGHKFDPFAAVRARMERVTYAGMDETPAAVTMAVLTGNTSGIERDLLENVRRGGIAHIFAVSGLHMGALYAFCLFLMKKTSLSRWSKFSRFLLVFGVLFFYAGVCGFTASVVRALILCVCSYAFKLIGIKTDSLELLGLAAFLILLFDPIQLFCVGFHLSFAACFGIVFLAKPLGRVLNNGIERVILCFAGKHREEVLERRKQREDLPPTVGESIRRWAVSLLSVSFAAQIATTPILLQTFGYVSCWAILLNLLFVPLISATFSLLLIFVLIACVLPVSAASVILYLPSMLWSAVLLTFEILDFSSFMIRGFTLTGWAIVCYYLACTLCSDKWNLSKKLRRGYACGLLLAFGIVTCVANFPLIW